MWLYTVVVCWWTDYRDLQVSGTKEDAQVQQGHVQGWPLAMPGNGKRRQPAGAKAGSPCRAPFLLPRWSGSLLECIALRKERGGPG